MNLAHFLFACGTVACLGAAAAQDMAAASTLDRWQARDAARAEQLRRNWLASGHAPSADPAAQISAGKILTPRINVAVAPAAPVISVNFTTGPAGLSFVSATFISGAPFQTLNLTYITPSGSPPLTKGTLRLQRVGNAFGQGAFNLYSAAGPWTLTALSIFDAAGNGTRYSQTQLADLFPSLTVNVTNGGKPDTAVPLISAGRVLTRKVSLGSAKPAFGVRLTVSDDISGVQFALLDVSPPDSSSGRGVNTGGTAPIRNGNLDVYVPLSGATATGAWKITQFGLCDVAGNCSFDGSAADIQSLFGTTTFTVTR